MRGGVELGHDDDAALVRMRDHGLDGLGGVNLAGKKRIAFKDKERDTKEKS